MTVKLEPIPDYGDLLPLDEFLDAVKDGVFIDYDGFGCLATETEMSDIVVQPSTVRAILEEFDDLAGLDHVVWFNR